jgi:hypothetical protein
VLSKSNHVRIRASTSKDLGIVFCNHTPALSLECPADDRRTTALRTGHHYLVNEVDKVI